MADIPNAGLILTIGCPGAGKSTWAEQNLAPATLRLERDRFRECLFGSRRAYHDSPLDPEQRSDLVTRSMLAAMQAWPTPSWAVTDTNLEFKRVYPFIQQAEGLFTLVIFPRTWEYLENVNNTRPVAHRIPPDILRDRYEVFNDPGAWWRLGKHNTIEVPQDD